MRIYLFLSILVSTVLCFSDPTLIKSTTSNHTNNWAVLVSSSRFWFNYRHLSNALAMYHTVKRLGIPDSNIILMLADDISCNPRNVHPGQVFRLPDHKLDIYGEAIEVDYKGYEVTVENFVRLLTNRLPPSTPLSKRLNTDHNSNILVYMTGHGGDGFLKFQDFEEITSQEIADSFHQMNEKQRYNEILFISDTCEANSLYKNIKSPNIVSLGSSDIGEKSYSYENDPELGVSVIERYTHFALEFLNNVQPGSKVTLNDFIDFINPSKVGANPGKVIDQTERPFNEFLVMDFFGSVQTGLLTKLERHKTANQSSINQPIAKVNTIEPLPWVDIKQLDFNLEPEITSDNGIMSYLKELFIPIADLHLYLLQPSKPLPAIPSFAASGLLLLPIIWVALS